jgi:hypothetical protein
MTIGCPMIAWDGRSHPGPEKRASVTLASSRTPVNSNPTRESKDLKKDIHKMFEKFPGQ